MEILDPKPEVGVVFGEVFGHSLGQRGDQYTLALLNTLSDLLQEIVNLISCSFYRDIGIDQTGRANDLFHHFLSCLLEFVIPGGGRYVDHLMDAVLEFGEIEGTVVQCGGKPETVFDQCFLSRPITPVHPHQLGNGDVTFVYDQEEIPGEVIQ